MLRAVVEGEERARGPRETEELARVDSVRAGVGGEEL
jgi:hypothetical protein